MPISGFAVLLSVSGLGDFTEMLSLSGVNDSLRFILFMLRNTYGVFNPLSNSRAAIATPAEQRIRRILSQYFVSPERHRPYYPAEPTSSPSPSRGKVGSNWYAVTWCSA